MVWTQRWLAGAAVVAVGLTIAPVAQAGWFGFGNRTAEPGAGITLVQSGSDNARLDQLEQTIRSLTGQVETLQHQLDVLTNELQKMQADNEYRFSQLENGGGGGKSSGGGKKDVAAAPAPEQAPAPQQVPAPQAAPAPQVAPGSGAVASDSQQQLGAPPQPLGTLTLPAPAAGGQQPLDLSALARGDAPATDGAAPVQQPPQTLAPPSGDPAADYKTAYELFVSGQYALAETAFRQFLGAYPGDKRFAEATYWLGQSLFSRGMFRDAATEFVNSYKLDPKSPRAADTMLLLGKSLAGIPEQVAACQTFAAALKQYPSMSSALHQRFITEQANAGCKG